MIPTIFGVILLIFILFNWVGGDPAMVLAGKISNPEQIERERRDRLAQEVCDGALLDDRGLLREPEGRAARDGEDHGLRLPPAMDLPDARATAPGCE